MKQLIKNYTFSTSGPTITCTDFNAAQPLRLDRLLVISDAKTSKTLWSPVDATLSTATVTSNNVITLSGLQGGEANGDSLLIYYETQPGDPNYSGPLPTNFLDILPASVNITAADVASSTTTGANNQSIITGTPTANSAAAVTLAGIEALRVQVSGTWVGALVCEISFDSGTTWYTTGVHQSGTNYNASSFTANFGGHSNVAGCTNYRIRCTAYTSGTAVVKMVETLNAASIYLANSPQIADGTTPSQKLAVDASGRITEVNAATYLPIMGIPNINKGKCASGTLVAGAAGVNATFYGGDTFTANELVIVNLTGAAPVLYTLDGTAASAGGNVGAYAGTNGAALSTLSTLTFSATTGLWGTSGIGTIVTSGGTHTFAWTGQSGSTLTGCTYSAPTTDTVATAAVITQLANAQGCVPSIGADIIPCNTTSPTVSLASTGVPQYLVIVRGA